MVYDPAFDMPLENWQPTSSYVLPVNPPAVPPDAGTQVCLGPIAREWLPYILGSLDQLRNPATWIASNDAAMFGILAQVTMLKSLLSMPGPCASPDAGGLIVGVLLNYRAVTDIANGLALSAHTWTDIDTAKTFTIVDNPSTTVSVSIGGSVLCGGYSGELEGSSRIVIDGTVAYNIGGGYTLGSYYNVLAGAEPIVIEGLDAGEHTVQFQVYASSASSCYCRALTQSVYESFYITVQQFVAGSGSGGGDEFRLTDGTGTGEGGQGQFQYSVDGGIHWITVPGWNENVCKLVKHCIPSVGIPDNPGDLPSDKLSCAIAGYLADQIIRLSFQKALDALTENLILLDFGALVLTLIPEFVLVAAFYDAVTFIYNLIAISDRSAFEDAVADSDLWMDVTCAIYNAILADGYVTPENFGIILGNLGAISYSHPAVITAIVGYVTHLGPTGLAQLSQRAGLGNGLHCQCGHWCYRWAPGAADLCGGQWTVPLGGFGTCGANQWHSQDIGGSFQLNVEAVFSDAYPIDGITVEGVWEGSSTHLIAYDAAGTVVLDQESLTWADNLFNIKHIAIVIDGPDSATIDAITLHGRGDNPFGADNCDEDAWCRRYTFSELGEVFNVVDGFYSDGSYISTVGESKYGGGGTQDGLIIETGNGMGGGFAGGTGHVHLIRVRGTASGTSDTPSDVHFGRGIFVAGVMVGELPNTPGAFDVTVDVSAATPGLGFVVSVCNTPSAEGAPNTVTVIQAWGNGDSPTDGTPC